jgi:Ni,Fe-hydrogenase III small subunit
VLASQRVQYYQSFNEVVAQDPSAAQTSLYFSWFDRVSSPGFKGDNVHVLNPGTATANVTVHIPGCTDQTHAIASSAEWYATCPNGFGGPVKVSSDQPVLASQRVQYFQSFNEVVAQGSSAAQSKLDFTWFDRVSSPGFQGDNVHIINPGTATANVTVHIPGCSDQSQAIAAGQEQYLTCPGGFGGPVTVSSDVPVLASQRVQYYQSFNEVLAQAPPAAKSTLYFTWFDRISSPGFQGDNVHIINPQTTAANVTVHIPGCTDQPGSIGAGQEGIFTCGSGFGGPVTIASDQPVLASQRVQYYQSFNEVLGLTQ